MENRIELHRRFWKGGGPSLILIPPFREELYDLNDYPARFQDPRLMWESEIRRARALIDHPTDGIPTVRPNLGVITIPAMAGQTFNTPADSMPWPGKPLDKDSIKAAGVTDLNQSEIYRLISDFYKIHAESGESQIIPYLPDTQGVFDIAHLLYGDDVFYEVLDGGEDSWFTELMEISLVLYHKATTECKALLNEGQHSMVHGHGTEQGVFFPHCGARIAEDTAILLSPEMIEELIIPFLKRSVAPFGGGFLHFCGYHPTIFSQFSALSEIKAIDLGNPEKYDLKWLLERCAETNTVLYSRVAEEPGESWKEYIERIGSLVSSTGARVILRPKVFPESAEECQAMMDQWHDMTIKSISGDPW
jgi:hypothetical protein